MNLRTSFGLTFADAACTQPVALRDAATCGSPPDSISSASPLDEHVLDPAPLDSFPDLGPIAAPDASASD